MAAETIRAVVSIVLAAVLFGGLALAVVDGLIHADRKDDFKPFED